MTTIPSTPSVRTLIELLLDGAGPEDLHSAQSQLLRAGDAAAQIDDQTLQSAVELHGLLEQRKQRANELVVLNDIASNLAATHDREPLLAEIVRQSRRLLNVDLAYLGLITDGGVQIKVTDGALSTQLDNLMVPASEGVMGKVLATSAAAWTSDYLADSTFPHNGVSNSAAEAEIIHGLLGVPLKTGGGLLGVLCVAKRQERRFTEHEVVLLSALAAHASVAIDTAQLLHQYRETVEEVQAAQRETERHASDLEQTLAWDAALTQIVLRGGGLREMLDEASRSAGHEIVFVNRIEEIQTLLPIDVTVRSEQAARSDAGDSDRVNQVLGTLEVISRPVIATGTLLGYLVAVASTTQSADIGLVIDRATPVVALVLAAERAAQESVRRARDAFVIDLLTRRPRSDADFAQQLRLAGLPKAAVYTVAVVQFDGEIAHARREIERSSRYEKSVIAEHGRRLVMVVPSVNASDFSRAWQNSAALLTVGAACSGDGSQSIVEVYTEAEQVLNALFVLGRTGTCASPRDFGVYRILLSRTGKDEIEALTEDRLGPLLREQEQRGAPLLETLAAYLGNARKHAATATELGVHVNTLYQRLATIDRLLGENWREADNVLEIQLVLRLRQLYTQLGRQTTPVT